MRLTKKILKIGLIMPLLPMLTTAYGEAAAMPINTNQPHAGAQYSNTSDSLTTMLKDFYGLWNIDVAQISCVELYVRGISWLGVQYKYGHISKNGIDCSGFVKEMLTGLYGDRLMGGAKDIFHQCKPLEKEMLSEGDLVFFTINKPYISHIGIYLQNNKFIHATVRGGVTISDLNDDYYQKYYFASGRLK